MEGDKDALTVLDVRFLDTYKCREVLEHVGECVFFTHSFTIATEIEKSSSYRLTVQILLCLI
jgi:hypothetical protein